jgi:high-affinity nickel permease
MELIGGIGAATTTEPTVLNIPAATIALRITVHPLMIYPLMVEHSRTIAGLSI